MGVATPSPQLPHVTRVWSRVTAATYPSPAHAIYRNKRKSAMERYSIYSALLTEISPCRRYCPSATPPNTRRLPESSRTAVHATPSRTSRTPSILRTRVSLSQERSWVSRLHPRFQSPRLPLSWPAALLPQHSKWPSVHTTADAAGPARTASGMAPLGKGALPGSHRSSRLPDPSWPWLLHPQVKMCPSADRASAWPSPADTATMLADRRRSVHTTYTAYVLGKGNDCWV